MGKSSILNRILGEKVAIVSPKPQTTRTRIMGVYTKGADQIAFLDTPGLLRGPQPAGAVYGQIGAQLGVGGGRLPVGGTGRLQNQPG